MSDHDHGRAAASPDASSAVFSPVSSQPSLLAGDVGERLITRRAAVQSYADVGVTRSIDRKLAWTIGLGTAFNSVDNAKAHYLATGLAFRP